MQYTPEQQQDFSERAKAFQEEYKPFYDALKEKHEVELSYGVVTIPSQQGLFALGVQENIGDLKYKSVPSPDEFIKTAE